MIVSIIEDHKRFKDIVKGKVRENLRRFIAQDHMIGKQEDKYIKIPIPYIDIPHFRYGPKQMGGVGQGSGSAQGTDGSPGSGNQNAGDQPGDHLLEVEFTVDEIVDLIAQELQLPNIQPKGNKYISSESKKYTTIAPVGPDSLRHFKQTYKKALKRLIASGQYQYDSPIVIPERQDFLYRSPKTLLEKQAQAVIFYIMDVSGSMREEQKQIVRITSFWLHAWIKRFYKGIKNRFIVHDAQAQEVNEETFFRISEAGGTLISSSYKLVQSIIEKEYPVNEWNIYIFQFSDGDNWNADDTRLCINLLKLFPSQGQSFCLRAS